MDELTKTRQQITAIDQQVAQLLSQRFAAVVEVGRIKEKQQLAVLDQGREQRVLENVKAHSAPEFAEYIAGIYQEIMRQARNYQANQRK